MKILITILCSIAITAGAQTFNRFEDVTFTGTKVFKNSYALATPTTTKQPLRFWACATAATPTKPDGTPSLANVTLTWQHAGITVSKEVVGMKSWGIVEYQVDVEDFIGVAPQGEWTFQMKASAPVTLQNWGVKELPTPKPLTQQYCPQHRDEGTITSRGVIKGPTIPGQPQTNVLYIVYSHAIKNAPLHSWTNCSIVVTPSQLPIKDK